MRGAHSENPHVGELIALAERIVRESGDPATFEAKRWVSRWLEAPAPALGGRLPGDLLDTEVGRQVVFDLLSREQSGGYG